MGNLICVLSFTVVWWYFR